MHISVVDDIIDTQIKRRLSAQGIAEDVQGAGLFQRKCYDYYYDPLWRNHIRHSHFNFMGKLWIVGSRKGMETKIKIV